MVVVVIPAFKVKRHILDVIARLGPEVDKILVVDDHCPEQSGLFVRENSTDPRLEVLYNEKNLGVGGTVKRGYVRALDLNADVVIKIDGDDQMDPAYLKSFISLIVDHGFDYAKGNRFFYLDELMKMPKTRLIGNGLLSLINKFVNGYWNIMDPTNGYTAIRGDMLRQLPLHKIDNRYFFESDMLFRLSIHRAVVQDLAIPARYAGERSNLSIKRVLWEFPPKYINRFFKRILYLYFLRDFNVASIEMLLGSALMIFGTVFGIHFWLKSLSTGSLTSSGSVMLSALPIILGFQLLLSALNFDIQNVPKKTENTSRKPR